MLIPRERGGSRFSQVSKVPVSRQGCGGFYFLGCALSRRCSYGMYGPGQARLGALGSLIGKADGQWQQASTSSPVNNLM